MTKYQQLLISIASIATALLLVACNPAQEVENTAAVEQAASKIATAKPEPPELDEEARRKLNASPPPQPKDGRGRDEYVPAGTASSDGIGVTVRSAATADTYTEENITYVPWEDESTIQPLKAGAALPDGAVAMQKNGEKFDLNAAVAETPTVLIYYRGGWCPYCNAYLRDLQKSVPALREMGYQLLAVSTDTVAALNEYDDSKFNYKLFADPDLELATKLGIKYKLVQEYVEHLKVIPRGRAFDVEERNGGYMVTPGAFILDTNGIVRFSYANNNYAVRASQESMLQAAKKALEK